MTGIKFSLSISIDETTGAVRMAYLRVRDGKSVETREHSNGLALADYDQHGNLIGVELLAPCSGKILNRITASEPEPVKRFLRSAAPRKLVTA